jgi:hypothetical protein
MVVPRRLARGWLRIGLGVIVSKLCMLRCPCMRKHEQERGAGWGVHAGSGREGLGRWFWARAGSRFAPNLHRASPSA